MVYSNYTKRLWLFNFLSKKCTLLHHGQTLIKMCNAISFMYVHTIFFIGNIGGSSSHVFLYTLFSVARHTRQEISYKYIFCLLMLY